ncbi:MAG: right-handed parallel beta-helix repeat-containing protein [Phycisphaerales bacterium]|nr:MAG: right-handed parallel beta-helix repeat-containing protein [Phycisphaerales bacterium]
MRHARTIFAITASAILLSLATLALAGPLNPPAGPIISTGKTTQEIFDKTAAAEPRIAINATNTPGDADSVYRISVSGSYYLSDNLIITALNKHGIEIAASNVTIDLNGFLLAGPLGAGFDGIRTSVAGLRSLEIRNGTITGFGGDGIDFQTFNTTGCIVRNIRSQGNGSAGMRIGIASTIIGCSANTNGSSGITAGIVSTISDCTAYSNASHGIQSLGNGTITGCTASSNGAFGFAINSNATITGCTATDNGDIGISGGNSTISNCTSSSNGGEGIAASTGSTVTGCTANSNTLDGILVDSRCLVTRSTCSSNGVNPGDGAGIRVVGNDNRIEGNHCSSADRGIDVDGTGNIIIRNTCSGNTINWTIVSGNSYLVVFAPATVGNFSGNASGAGFGTTDPNANFTY